jgi:hypothetical protein
MSTVGLATAANTVGVDRGTLRRWRWRDSRGLLLARRRGPRPLPIPVAAHAQAARLVRDLRGLIGAEALRRDCPGLTRRGAARIKAETCTAMERERRSRAARVEVSSPGVIRGFDAMHLGLAGHLLVSGDGALPYRTSWTLAPRYKRSFGRTCHRGRLRSEWSAAGAPARSRAAARRRRRAPRAHRVRRAGAPWSVALPAVLRPARAAESRPTGMAAGRFRSGRSRHPRSHDGIAEQSMAQA